MPQIGSIFSGVNSLIFSFELVEAFGVAGDVLLVGQAFGDDGVDHRVQHRDVAAGLEGEMLARRGATAICRRGSITISLAPRLAAFLMKVAATGWFTVGLAPITMMTSASMRGRERRRHRAGVQAFHQRRDRGGVAQPRAMVDVVGAETGAHQLLEQIGLLVRALGRTEAGERLDALLVADFARAPWRRYRAPLPSDASRKCVKGLAGSTWSLASFFAFGSRTSGLVRRCG